MPTGRVLLQDGCLRDGCHSISIPTDLLPINPKCQLVLCISVCHTCWSGVSQSACLLVWCFTICHVFRCCASISAITAGVALHYRSYLLDWCLTINLACCCGASLYAMPSVLYLAISVPAGVVPYYKSMPSGVVLHYQPCLLVWCLTIGNAFWCVSRYQLCLLVLYLLIKSYLLVWCFTISHVCWCGASL